MHLSVAVVYGQAEGHYNLVQNEPLSKKFTEKEGSRDGREWHRGVWACVSYREAARGARGGLRLQIGELSQVLHTGTTLWVKK